MCSPHSGPLRDVHGVREEKREETGVTRRIKGEFKRRETDSASNQFPKCSPQPRTHKEIHRFGQRREGEGRRQRRPGREKGESKGGESNQAGDLAPKGKVGTEDWVLKGTKLITNTNKQRLKIQSRGQILKNTILKKKSQKL